MIIYLITFCLTLFYVVFLFWCQNNWLKIRDKSLDDLRVTNIKVAIVIAARNEEANLPILLRSLIIQSYPKENYQIIVSDDHSTDNTIKITENIFKENNIKNGKCVSSPKESKKEALTYAIRNTEAELIISTDADTTMDKDWISSMVQEYESSGAYLICGPVKLTGQNNIFEKLQSIEFTGLSGIGASGIISNLPMFCNGANLAFSKKIFDEVDGYKHSLSYSGDDTQLMLKIHKSYKGKISFLKDSRAIIQTSVIKRNSDLLEQRKRWASKIPNTLSGFTIFISVLVWLVHFFLLIYFVKALMDFNFLLLFLPFIMITVSEIVLLKSVGKFFKENIPSWLVIVVLPFYCIYIVSVGLLAPFSTYQWKGRKVK